MKKIVKLNRGIEKRTLGESKKLSERFIVYLFE